MLAYLEVNLVSLPCYAFENTAYKTFKKKSVGAFVVRFSESKPGWIGNLFYNYDFIVYQRKAFFKNGIYVNQIKIRAMDLTGG